MSEHIGQKGQRLGRADFQTLVVLAASIQVHMDRVVIGGGKDSLYWVIGGGRLSAMQILIWLLEKLDHNSLCLHQVP